MPRSSKLPDTCKWGGNELRGILKFSQTESNGKDAELWKRFFRNKSGVGAMFYFFSKER